MALRAVSRPRPLEDTEGVLPLILSFCDREKSLSLVSRAFRDSNRYPMVDVGLQILMRGADYEAQMVRESRRFINAGESQEQACTRQRGELAGRFSLIRAQFSLVEMGLFAELFSRLFSRLIHTDPKTLIFFGEMNEAYRTFNQTLVEAEAAREAAKDAILQIMKRYVCRESLRLRAEHVFRGRLDPDAELLHTQSAACLRELHLSQRNRLSVHGEMFADFVRHTETSKNSFSVERFVQQEGPCIAIESKEDFALVRLWDDLRLNSPAIFPAQVARDAQSIREWMNTHDAELQQITYLPLFNYATLPPEIGKFRGLTRLDISIVQNNEFAAPYMLLRTLPDELANLTNLTRLTIRVSDFESIPEVLSRVNATVTIERNLTRDGNLRRAILPESVARQHCSGIMSHLREFHWGAIGRAARRVNIGDEEFPLFMGLKRPQELAEIPFFLWFRDTFSIPYLHQLGDPFFNTMYVIENTLRELIERVPFLEIPVGIAMMVGIAATGLTFLPPMFLLNLPILLFNLLLDYTVQPAVTLCRSLLGYNPMVRLPA